MRRRASLLATVSVATLAVPLLGAVGASAAPSPDNTNACFGQARAFYSSDGSGADGRDYFSQRKGDNAQMNADYKTDTCGKSTPPGQG